MTIKQAMIPEDGTESKAIRVDSDAEIQVLVFKESFAPNIDNLYHDVVEVPEARKYGMHFVTSGYNKESRSAAGWAGQFYVVATLYDNTTISVQPQSGSPFELVLPSFGTFTWVSYDSTDLIASGTLITSNAPITVVSGSLSGSNPYVSGSYISSIPPICSLADRYMIPHLISHNTESPGFSLHVVASENNTLVEFDGSVVELALVGNSVTFEVNSGGWMSLNCSKNCLAVQYAKSLRSSSGIYGMLMLVILGANEFYGSTSFMALDVNPRSTISIIVEEEMRGTDIMLNGDSLGHLEWEINYGYSTAETTIDEGTYVMQSVSNRPFVVYVSCHWRIGYDTSAGAGYTSVPAERGIPTTPSSATTTSVTSPPMTTVSPSPPPATPPPTDGNYTLPQLAVRLNGTVYTEDGEDMSPQCAQVTVTVLEKKKKMYTLMNLLFIKKCFPQIHSRNLTL